MYKNLCTDGLGVSIRQNELIELALTYGYKGIEVDMEDMVGRAEKMGDQFATQFVKAAPVDISTFDLPINFSASDADYAAEINTKLEKICSLAESIGAKHCYIKVAANHPDLPYVENFEKHRERISNVADRLAKINVKVGLQFSAGVPNGEAMQFVHKPEEVLALVKAIGNENVGFVLDVWNWQVAGGTFDEIKGLDWSKVTEVRLADPPEGFDPESVERSKRQEPGSHSGSLCQQTVDLLASSNFEGPVAVTALVAKSGKNGGDILFQRISNVFDVLVNGEPEPEETTEEGAEGTETAATEDSEKKPVAAS